jgi:hypothetical protein
VGCALSSDRGEAREEPGQGDEEGRGEYGAGEGRVERIRDAEMREWVWTSEL